MLCLFYTTTQAQQTTEAKIDKLISEMTLAEKVGQMTQLTLDVVCKGKHLDDTKTF